MSRKSGSVWWGVHNDEDEVVHDHPRPEPKYEADKVIPHHHNGHGPAGRSGDGDRGREGVRTSGRGSRVQRSAQSARISKLVLYKRNGSWRIVRVFSI